MAKDDNFNKSLEIYNNPNSSEHAKKLAKADMDKRSKRANAWNRKNNPKKYAEDKAKKAKNDLDFWEKEKKKYK